MQVDAREMFRGIARRNKAGGTYDKSTYPTSSTAVFEKLATFINDRGVCGMESAGFSARSSTPRGAGYHGPKTYDQADPSAARAYLECAEIIKQHSKSFYFSARLLPRGKRESIMALYAFCRLSDDLVDNSDGALDPQLARQDAKISLRDWARQNAETDPTCKHPVIWAWADTRERYRIPQLLVEELLAGIEMDLTISRYDTWNDLWLYCFRVASTVGLMSMYITGSDSEEAVHYAVTLGIALQLTNILRDVAEDSRAGRIYIPREDMDRFGCTDEMLMDGRVTPNFLCLMRFEIRRARAMYRAAWPGIALLSRDSRLAVTAAATVYRAILGKIEDANYDIFSSRVHLNAREKISSLPAIWLDSLSVRRPEHSLP